MEPICATASNASHQPDLREADWPYNPQKFAERPPDDLLSGGADLQGPELLPHEQCEYRRLKSCLSAGFPLCSAFAVYDSFYDADSNGGIVSLPGDEVLRGGHAV